MKVIQQAFKVSNEEYYSMHLHIINAVLPAKLTEKEIEVLSAFMALPKDLVSEGYFNPVARKKVLAKVGLSSAGLSNHIRAMIDKGFLTKSDDNDISIKAFLHPEDDGQGYQFKLVKK